MIPAENPHNVSDHKNDSSNNPKTDIRPNWKLTPNNAPIAIKSIVKIIEEMIKKFAIEKYIDGYVGGNLVKRGKPNPDIFEKALEISGMKGNECIVFEDSANGIQAAISAGIKCIGFNNKNQHSQDQSKALLTITEFTEENYERIRRLYLWKN